MWFVIGLITAHYLSYFAVGIAQQALYQKTAPDGLDRVEPFTYTLFLTTSASLTSFLFSLLALWTAHGFSQRKVYGVIVRRLRTNAVLRKDYLWVSLTFMAGKVAGNHSLTLVDYATQALAKCAKPVSVVILGILHFGLRFKSSDVICSVWIVTSLVVFNIFAQGNFSKKHTVSTIKGNTLLLFSLICDGLTGARLDRLVSRIRESLLPTCCPVMVLHHVPSEDAPTAPPFAHSHLMAAASTAISSFSRHSSSRNYPTRSERSGSISSSGDSPGDIALLDAEQLGGDGQDCVVSEQRRQSETLCEAQEKEASWRRKCSSVDAGDQVTAIRTDEGTCASYEMMCTINLLTSLFSCILGLIVEGTEGIGYFYRNPDAFTPMVVFCVVGALGQLCSFKCVSRLGSLQTSTITATRKVVMVVVSVLWFNTPLRPMQWMAITSVGLAVAWRTSLSYTSQTRQRLRRNLKAVLRRLPRVRPCWMPLGWGAQLEEPCDTSDPTIDQSPAICPVAPTLTQLPKSFLSIPPVFHYPHIAELTRSTVTPFTLESGPPVALVAQGSVLSGGSQSSLAADSVVELKDPASLYGTRVAFNEETEGYLIRCGNADTTASTIPDTEDTTSRTSPGQRLSSRVINMLSPFQSRPPLVAVPSTL
eukprot:GHVS01088938.1.p1 GENE.GHVS01088938.1~~GHVS01088938.1.p1  ORF type:complete len:647 (-),score=47.10 GHVS01088938.1:236-2176(-)